MSPPNSSFDTTLISHLLPLLLFFFFILSISPASSSYLSTIAVSRVANQTLVCALLPSPCRTRYDLNCTALPSGRSRTYPSGTAVYSAIAAGDGFLCALANLPATNTTAMRWWDLTKKRNSSVTVIDDFKRLYLGPPLRALNAGDSHVCGILGQNGTPYCWRWQQLSLPPGLNVTSIAVGGDFLCALLFNGSVKCFGRDVNVVGKEPAGNYSLISAGTSHACAVSIYGRIGCWGSGGGASVTVGVPLMDVASLALGANATCVLRRNNGTVICWGDKIGLPEELVDAQFVAVEAKGSSFCGVLNENYSLVCWGNHVFTGLNSTVFQRVLPGSCSAESDCACGYLAGSGDLCLSGVICNSCKLQLSRPPPTETPAPSPKTSTNVPTTPANGTSKTKLAFVVLGAVGFGLGLFVVLAFLLHRVKEKSGRVHDSPAAAPVAVNEESPADERRLRPLLSISQNSFLEEFTMELLLAVTDGFSEQHKIGSGSFGAVYRAKLPDGRDVAIKRAELPAATPSSSSSHAAIKRRRDKESAFLAEVALLSRVNHKNLVRLLGYSREGQERILVYEFMTNGTLHDHLHKLHQSPLSSWHARFCAALDAARGIEYLHMYAVPPIIHRDIKSSNILLDNTWTAKVSDFGLSLLNVKTNAEDVQNAAGTVGYMDPEYYRLQHLTAKSDVYSFGVVLLETLTGSRVIQTYGESGTPRNVVEYTVPHIEADGVHRILDPRLPPPTPSEIEAVALVGYLAADCVAPYGRDRPDMTDVVAALERAVAACDELLLPPPPLPRSATVRSL